MGEKWDEISIFQPHFLTALTARKMGSFATHPHSQPQRLVRVLASAARWHLWPSGAGRRGGGHHNLPPYPRLLRRTM